MTAPRPRQPLQPPAEVEIDEELVRALLAEQHPDLADRPLTPLDVGWDNASWRLGGDLLVRLPRRLPATLLTVHEQRWLPELAPRLPLPVPAPVRTGRPGGRYPWPWSVVPWFEGEPGDRAALAGGDDAAGRLGRFLAALHVEAPPDAPSNPYRGVPLGERAHAFETRLVELAGEVDVAAARAVWEDGLAAPPAGGPPVWLHGDLHPANVVVRHGRLAAVLDWGDVCRGDPATDLAAAWMLLPDPAKSRPAFTAAYGWVDAALARRARAWAALFGMNLLAIGLDNRPSYDPVGRATLARLGITA